MAIDMRKTPSYLKGLAETRARVAGDLQRHEKQHSQLEVTLNATKADLERHQRRYTGVCKGLAEAKADLESCDRLIRKFDDRLDPSQIEPIHAWKGRYGKRGGLKEMIDQVLKDFAPVAMTTPELAQAVMAEFQLEFATEKALKMWSHNSLGRSLKILVAAGLVERLHDPKIYWGGKDGMWRWKTGTDRLLAGLMESAESAGLGVQQAKRRGRPVKLKKTTHAAAVEG